MLVSPPDEFGFCFASEDLRTFRIHGRPSWALPAPKDQPALPVERPWRPTGAKSSTAAGVSLAVDANTACRKYMEDSRWRLVVRQVRHPFTQAYC